MNKIKIQNQNMKGQKLACRYTRDDDGIPISVQGDADGVFDMPERDANLILGTPGWSLAKSPAKPTAAASQAAPQAAKSLKAPKPLTEPKKPQTPAQEADTEPPPPGEEEDSEESDEEGDEDEEDSEEGDEEDEEKEVPLSKLTKAELVQLAEDNGIPMPDEVLHGNKPEMISYLEKKLP